MDIEIAGKIASLMGSIKISCHGTQNHTFTIDEFMSQLESKIIQPERKEQEQPIQEEIQPETKEQQPIQEETQPETKEEQPTDNANKEPTNFEETNEDEKK